MEVISYWQLRSENNFNEFLHQYNSYNEKRNEAISAHQAFIEPILMETQGMEIGKDITPRLSEYLVNVAAVYKEWSEQSNRRWPQVIQEKLIKPLRKLNKGYKSHIALKMNVNLLQASIHYENLSRLEKVTEKQFFFYYVLFKAKKKILVKIKVIFSISFFTLFKNITQRFRKRRTKKTA